MRRTIDAILAEAHAGKLIADAAAFNLNARTGGGLALPMLGLVGGCDPCCLNPYPVIYPPDEGGGPPVINNCCPSGVPFTLTVTITKNTSDCACLAAGGAGGTLSWNGTTSRWEGVLGFCAAHISTQLRCRLQGASWIYTMDLVGSDVPTCPSPTTIDQGTYVCTPFSMDMLVPGLPTCGCVSNAGFTNWHFA